MSFSYQYKVNNKVIIFDKHQMKTTIKRQLGRYFCRKVIDHALIESSMYIL